MIKAIKIRWQSMAAWQIILLCLLIGFVVILIVSWRYIFPRPRQTIPAPLPPLPADAVAIESLSSLGFFEADIRIQAADGQIYTYLERREEGQEWSLETFPASGNDGESCSAKIISLFRASAGPIEDCQTAAISGEWCPGPIMSLAVTRTGEIWQTAENPSCFFAFQLGVWLIKPYFLLLGLIIIGFRFLVNWRRKRALKIRHIDGDQFVNF